MSKIAEVEPYEKEITRLKAELRKEKAKVFHLQASFKAVCKPNQKLENLKHEIRKIAKDHKVTGENMLDILLKKLNLIVEETLK